MGKMFSWQQLMELTLVLSHKSSTHSSPRWRRKGKKKIIPWCFYKGPKTKVRTRERSEKRSGEKKSRQTRRRRCSKNFKWMTVRQRTNRFQRQKGGRGAWWYIKSKLKGELTKGGVNLKQEEARRRSDGQTAVSGALGFCSSIHYLWQQQNDSGWLTWLIIYRLSPMNY